MAKAVGLCDIELSIVHEILFVNIVSNKDTY